MERVTASSTTTLLADTNPLRIVLFGMPYAGKSSLLGALAEVAEHQGQGLTGHLADPSHGLADLQHRLYDGTPQQTSEEVVPYPVTFEPFSASGRRTAMLVDCDGRIVNELITGRRTMHSANSSGVLSDSVLRADALVLVIDASSSPSKMDADFGEFAAFLRHFQSSRGDRTAVGGLPVFLVLSKCDLLAHPHDAVDDWIHHIEEKKQDVARRFQEFIAKQANATLSFGAIDLHVWATAVKRPALSNAPARPREPFGVGELFSQCLEQAAVFRNRHRRSQRLLAAIVIGTAIGLGLLLALAVGLTVYRGSNRGGGLAEQVESFQLRDSQQTTAERLSEPLSSKRRELIDIRNHPEFDNLSNTDHALIADRLTELDAYVAYKEKLKTIKVDDLVMLKSLEQTERAVIDLVSPPIYRGEWSATEAEQQRQRLISELAALRKGVSQVVNWFHQQTRKIEELRTFAKEKPNDVASWKLWMQTARGVLETPVPFSDASPLPGSENLAYANVLRFDQVVSARTAMENAARRLNINMQMFASLGLGGPLPDGKPQPLDIPAGFTLDQAPVLWAKLNERYQAFADSVDTSEFLNQPEQDVRRVAQRSFDHLIEAGRSNVLARLRSESTDGKETLVAWRNFLLTSLDAKEAWDAWEVLAILLARILDPSNTRNIPPLNPVIALELFIAHDTFELDIRQAILKIPNDWNLKPTGPLTIHMGRDAHAPPVLVLKLVNEKGEADTERNATVYSFVSEAGSTLTYQPGDHFYASLPVKKDGDPTAWRLTWARRRSAVWAFEALSRPPRLHRADQENTEGELLEDVSLQTLPPSGLPKVPDLVPVVNLKK